MEKKEQDEESLAQRFPELTTTGKTTPLQEESKPEQKLYSDDIIGLHDRIAALEQQLKEREQTITYFIRTRKEFEEGANLEFRKQQNRQQEAFNKTRNELSRLESELKAAREEIERMKNTRS